MSKDKQALVVIIVSNYNGVRTKYKETPLIDVSLKSLGMTSHKNYRIIVADNASTDNSVEYVRRHYPEVEITQTGVGVNFSVNNNRAIRHAMEKNPDYLLLINNDIIVSDPLWLDKLVESAEEKTVGIVGCRLLYPDGRIQHAGLIIDAAPRCRGRADVDRPEYQTTMPIDGITGALMLIKSEVVKRIGLLDENFYIGYEDDDYCMRAREAGFGVLYNGEVALTHLEGHSTYDSPDENERAKRLKVFYNQQRNYYYFIRKYEKKRSFWITAESVCALFLGSVFSIEGKDRPRKITSLRFKDRPLHRIRLTFDAISSVKKA